MEMTAKQVEELVNQVVAQLSAEKKAGIAKPIITDEAQMALGAGGTEPFDKEYGFMDYSGKSDPSPFPRVNRILRRVKEIKPRVDDERAMLYTEAHKKYAGGSVPLMNAKILLHILSNVTINIYPDELVVGELACPRRNAPVFPEFSYDWIVDEIKNSPWDQRSNDNFQLSAEAKDHLLDISDYWDGKTVKDGIISLLTEEELKGTPEGGRPVFHPNLYLYGGIGHLIARYQTLFTLGYGGLKQRIMEKLNEVDLTAPDGTEKREFYTAQLISLEAAGIYFKRYAKLAAEMAEKETDPQRKQELQTISANCDWVSENPPRNFWEAMQLYHLATNIIEIESNGHSISYGRFDQLLYPYYEKDMKDGTLTKTQVLEIIECFYIKIYELLKLRDEISAILNSEVGIAGTILLVGGCDKDGNDATNDLSYLALEAHAHTQLPDPWMSSRWSANTPWEFKVKLVNTIKVGTGQPKLFNDEAIIPALIAGGRTLEHARDYSVIGCVEIDTGGLEYGAHDSSYFSMPKAFELAINDGRCVDCGPHCVRYQKCAGAGKTLGPRTGSLENFKNIEEVKKAYEIQIEYWVDRMATFINATETMHARLKPLPYISCLIEGCIDKGKDVSRGGAIYNYSCPQGVGTGTVADGLCTIQQLIFEEKRITGSELLDALRKNWEGYKPLYTLINSDKVHHYGNDDDYADEFARWCTDVYCAAVEKHHCTRENGRFLPGVYCVSANVGIGLVQGASPDGRVAKEAVSNCVGPVHTVVGCHDVKGPTAMAKSAAKLDHIRAGNGTLMNVRFTPGCVSGETGRDNFINFIDTYFQRKGQHCQFNIVNTETLKDAQKHPENYQGLLVRVAGYSAYFVKLSKELQDDLIGRNSYDTFD